jgi:hypothetical protein
MPFDLDMLRQGIDLDILIFLVQIHPQLVPQCRQVAGDFAHSGQVQVAAALVVGVDGEVFAGGARDVVFWRGERYVDGAGCAGCWGEFQGGEGVRGGGLRGGRGWREDGVGF